MLRPKLLERVLLQGVLKRWARSLREACDFGVDIMLEELSSQ